MNKIYHGQYLSFDENELSFFVNKWKDVVNAANILVFLVLN